MAKPRCPGQDMRHWKPEDIFELRCPHCGGEMEFFKDEPSLPCPSCRKEVRNPKIDLGCAKWCKFARECLGQLADATDQVGSLCDRIIEEMKRIFGDDHRRIEHALEVLKNAETILEAEPADPLAVKAAAILHDIGIREAERKHGSCSPRFQELEGPPIARTILDRLGLDEDTIAHVCRIVGSHHSANDIDTPEFRIVWDADWLVNIPDEFPTASREKLGALVARVFKTHKGRALAEERFLS